MLPDSTRPIMRPSTPVLDCARLLCYAVIDSSVKFSGRTLLFVDGKELGEVPCLAICEDKKSSGVLLFHCDEEWTTLGCSAHPSIAAAKMKAEKNYPGISNLWVEAGVSVETAEAYLKECFAGELCSFCGKRPDQVDQIFVRTTADKAQVHICDQCITAYHNQLAK